MQSTSSSVAPWQVCYYPIPNRYHSQHHLHLRLSNNKRTIPIPSPLNCQTHFTNNSFLTIPPTTSYSSSDQERKKNPIHKREFSEELFSPVDDNRQVIQSQIRKIEEGKAETESEVRVRSSNSTSMWWAEVKAAIGQRINVEGIVSSVSVVARDRHLALPHVSVPDIRYIDWEELKREGFKGVVFDKDNTITVPYSLKLWGPLGSSMEQCKAVFGNNIAVFSNSAGLSEFDPDGRKARAVEYGIGIKVIRHGVKKPAGTAEEIEKHFGCESSRLIMVGDRPFTDVVYGNRNGFLTVLTEPLSLAEEPFIVQQVRKLEVAIVNRWSRRGLTPKSHGLFPDPQRCVKDPPPL